MKSEDKNPNRNLSHCGRDFLGWTLPVFFGGRKKPSVNLGGKPALVEKVPKDGKGNWQADGRAFAGLSSGTCKYTSPEGKKRKGERNKPAENVYTVLGGNLRGCALIHGRGKENGIKTWGEEMMHPRDEEKGSRGIFGSKKKRKKRPLSWKIPQGEAFG